MSDGFKYEQELTGVGALQLAAAQLVEQLKRMNWQETELVITHQSGTWLVTVKLVRPGSGDEIVM